MDSYRQSLKSVQHTRGLLQECTIYIYYENRTQGKFKTFKRKYSSTTGKNLKI